MPPPEPSLTWGIRVARTPCPRGASVWPASVSSRGGVHVAFASLSSRGHPVAPHSLSHAGHPCDQHSVSSRGASMWTTLPLLQGHPCGPHPSSRRGIKCGPLILSLMQGVRVGQRPSPQQASMWTTLPQSRARRPCSPHSPSPQAEASIVSPHSPNLTRGIRVASTPSPHVGRPCGPCSLSLAGTSMWVYSLTHVGASRIDFTSHFRW